MTSGPGPHPEAIGFGENGPQAGHHVHQPGRERVLGRQPIVWHDDRTASLSASRTGRSVHGSPGCRRRIRRHARTGAFRSRRRAEPAPSPALRRYRACRLPGQRSFGVSAMSGARVPAPISVGRQGPPFGRRKSRRIDLRSVFLGHTAQESRHLWRQFVRQVYRGPFPPSGMAVRNTSGPSPRWWRYGGPGPRRPSRRPRAPRRR